MDTTIKFTRKDYLNNKCSYNEYYAQFITEQIVNYVQASIGKEKILASKDPHFNDIKLFAWDILAQVILQSTQYLRKAAGESGSLSASVCIAKAAAEQIRSNST